MIGPLFSLVLAASPPGPPVDDTGVRPNILFVVVDDLGCRDLSGEGHLRHRTPRLDAIREASIRFSNAYCNAPNCAPSRAALMTGRHGSRTGVHTVGSPKRGDAASRSLDPPANRTSLRDDEVTLAERLRLAGYRTGFVGKWHLGDDPTAQGFDVNVAGFRSGHPKSYFSPYRNPAMADGPAGEYLVDRLGCETVRMIEEMEAREPDQPWFVVYAPYAVHTPIQAPKVDVQNMRRRHPELTDREARYAVLVERMDAAVGTVVDTVDAARTFVFVMSDNGGLQPITDMAPWRGGKGMLYEGGVRTPLYVSGPGVDAREISTPVQLFDLFPTVLELAAVEPSDEVSIDGRSLGPMLAGGDFDRGPLFWHFPAYLEGRDSESRQPDRRFRTTPCGAVRSGRWKLIQWYEDGDLDLFDLETDPVESTDLSDSHPEQARELADVMSRWRVSISAPMPVAVPSGGE